ncbi:lachesin-like [Topomyia yanbarensis]|uniref:lachesin-like n=1 Tax=Topomyia yanbarensis TaxID=2498891 RepID=UPI00273C9AAA|nr:lachesin-like [Topomyia yanbarensis]
MVINGSSLRTVCRLAVLAVFVNGNSDSRNEQEPKPSFASPIENVTVPIGREATLSCAVQNLGAYKVGWMRASDQTVLALQGRVVTHNSRYSVTQEESNVWRLKIRNVRESDRGCYMCQINATPLQKQVGCVDVQLPPDISDEQSSSDTTIREGGNVTFYCKATGHPTPKVTWRRDDGSPLYLHRNETDVRKVDTHIGNFLNLSSVDRRQMGAYLCIASNEVPPAVSKRVYLNVHFAPNVTTAKTLLGVFEESDIELDCAIESSPRSVNYWTKVSSPGNAAKSFAGLGGGSPGSDGRNSLIPLVSPRQEVMLNGDRYEIREQYNSHYSGRMSLRIRRFGASDAGSYMCISSNAFGKANKTIRVYEIKRPTTTTTTTTTTSTTTTTTTTSTTTEQPTTIPVRRTTLMMQRIPEATPHGPPSDFIIEYITNSPAYVEYGANGETYINYPQLTAYSKSSPSNHGPGGAGGDGGGHHHHDGDASSSRSLLVPSREQRLMTILALTALSCLSFFRFFQIYLPWITFFLLLLLIGRKPKEKCFPVLTGQPV